ncbi:sigma-70 family RNA polymerase sigma factor [Alteromonas sp. 5E99-2]|uniref:RNA polymerase sigma factor n=1 Tax=Alteromonas sp. 5E99-2 TaxID=2817683 RepID=UPI001A9863E7|nr:sigma-70 family RNA polymerase sigma factor [Alteromonas sp. 5E99-2]MBO1254380.1 sigma-70 family RNA polymerase sigma factor [Alteromonas sp. 5E99-2]
MNNQGNVAAQNKFATKTEWDLIKAVQDGNKQAYHMLYQQYIGRVYGLCYRLTGDKMLAEDTTQEVFIQLWRKIGNYKGDSKFSTWLHTVASNITISYLRKQKSWIQNIFNIEDSVAMNAEAEASSCSVDLEGHIIRLPERARIVFVLHAIEGYRHDDIATMTGMAVGSSKAQFHRAKQLLKEWMGND